MCSVQGIFQHHFQCKKVRTILNKIWYKNIDKMTNCQSYSYFTLIRLTVIKLDILPYPDIGQNILVTMCKIRIIKSKKETEIVPGSFTNDRTNK